MNKICNITHPNPIFRRSNWISLDGMWKFCFDDNDVGRNESWFLNPNFDQTIEVPYAYQSPRSTVEDKTYHPILWYSKTFMLYDSIQPGAVHLCFGAVDYRTEVWVNGVFLGAHTGGYTPFRFPIHSLIKQKEANTITVRVEDFSDPGQPRGKQYWKDSNEMCWYQPSSGIWQPVWLEEAGDIYLKEALITPDIDRRCAELELCVEGISPGKEKDYEVQAVLTYQNETKMPGSFSMDPQYRPSQASDEPVATFRYSLARKRSRFILSFDEKDYIKDIHFWWPHAPNLYGVELKLLKNGQMIDCVQTYFGMRKIEIQGTQILLNNQPFYQKLVLDQGYWPDTHLTPSSTEALRADIEAAKRLGFNGARKHQKIEDPRYYYWADVLGFVVWGELPSAYNFTREEQSALMSDMEEFITRDYNHPCIITWIPLNESWGVRNIYSNVKQQNFAAALYHQIKALDDTRLIGNNDGWEQVSQTDFYGIHDYTPVGERLSPAYQDPETLLASCAQNRMCCATGHPPLQKPVLITEYGGIAFDDSSNDSWGYFGKVRDEEEYIARYRNITQAFRRLAYVQGYCYTQLTDVYQEKNGLMTMDRQFKIDPEIICAINNGD